MANITKTTASNYIPTIWAQESLEHLRNNMVMGRLVTRDADIEGAQQVGDTLNINYPGDFSANDKAAGSAVTLQTPANASQVQVVLNKHKEASFILEDVAAVEANQDLLSQYTAAAMIPIVESIENDLLGLYSVVTATVGTAGTDATAATLRLARKKLNDNKVAQNRRVAVISTKDEISLLGDSTLQSFFAFSQPEGVREGSFGRAYGFDLYLSQLVPATGSAPVSTHNLAFDPGAFILASRTLPHARPGTGVDQTSMVDPESGLAVRVTMAYNPTYLGTQVTIDVLYGVKLLRDAKATAVLT